MSSSGRRGLGLGCSSSQATSATPGRQPDVFATSIFSSFLQTLHEPFSINQPIHPFQSISPHTYSQPSSKWPLSTVSISPKLPSLPLHRHPPRSYQFKAQSSPIHLRSSANNSHTDLPPVKPSAIALGIVFNQAASLAVLAPLFGDTYQRAKQADSSEEFFKSREAATAAASWGSSLLGSGIQTYGVAALINATGTLSYKGAAYLGSLIFMASAAPGVRRDLLSHGFTS